MKFKAGSLFSLAWGCFNFCCKTCKSNEDRGLKERVMAVKEGHHIIIISLLHLFLKGYKSYLTLCKRLQETGKNLSILWPLYLVLVMCYSDIAFLPIQSERPYYLWQNCVNNFFRRKLFTTNIFTPQSMVSFAKCVLCLQLWVFTWQRTFARCWMF